MQKEIKTVYGPFDVSTLVEATRYGIWDVTALVRQCRTVRYGTLGRQHLVYRLVQFTNNRGQLRMGVCTSFLKNMMGKHDAIIDDELWVEEAFPARKPSRVPTFCLWGRRCAWTSAMVQTNNCWLGLERSKITGREKVLHVGWRLSLEHSLDGGAFQEAQTWC
ncbi:expressed unknown protein [Seminavis robusta]|uniref:Uncharacterized protein n=1 Tax=Seminavis robusta TaxID=568900 RepID=A0A9N8DIA9_9STRA|nr:expressed unknown protein [Seminavis robusta]|eukprot:Sro167_g074541.1  (163) ;mRNA; f:70428-70916